MKSLLVFVCVSIVACWGKSYLQGPPDDTGSPEVAITVKRLLALFEDAKRSGTESGSGEDEKRSDTGSGYDEDEKRSGMESGYDEDAKRSGMESGYDEDAKRSGTGSGYDEDAKGSGTGSEVTSAVKRLLALLEDAEDSGSGYDEDAKRSGTESGSGEDEKRSGTGSGYDEDAKRWGLESGYDEDAKRSGMESGYDEDAKRSGMESGYDEDAKGSGTGSEVASAVKRLLALLEGAKRSGTESEFDDKKCGLDTPGKVKKTHTACKETPAYNMKKSSPVDEKQKQLILNMHNQARRDVDPPAANMMEMKWDNELAMIAQKWAEQCKYRHDWYMSIPGKYGVGQNIGRYKYGLKGSWDEVIKAFVSEKNTWHYTGYKKSMKTGHYTQIIWADTTKVGCGAAVCKFPSKYFHPSSPEYLRDWYYYVCDYAPIGNRQRATPYKRSLKSCSGCGQCKNKLCVCKDDASKKQTSICHNGGKMNPKTCSCDCSGRMRSGYMCTECVDKKGKIYGRTCDNKQISGRFCRYWDVRMHCCDTCSKSPFK